MAMINMLFILLFGVSLKVTQKKEERREKEM